jgi:hypothetical protein
VKYECYKLLAPEHREVLEGCVKWLAAQRTTGDTYGLATVGAALAALIASPSYTLSPRFQDSPLFGDTLIDDVATTGASLQPFIVCGAKAIVLIKRLDIVPAEQLADITALVEVG